MSKKIKTNIEDLGKLRLELQRARLNIGARKEKNTNLAKNLKRNIARILTLINSKEGKNG